MPLLKRPWMSGWPSGVRGGVQFLGASDAAAFSTVATPLWAPAWTGNSTAAATIRVTSEPGNRWFIRSLLFTNSATYACLANHLTIRPSGAHWKLLSMGRLFSWLPAKRPIEHLLGERHAFVFQQLRILLHMTVQRHAHLPGTRKDLWVLNSGFIQEDIRAARSIAFHHV